MVKALIVDDESKARKSLAILLCQLGNVEVVSEASNGEEAIIMISQHRPDVVFLDVKMPMMGGFDVLDELNKMNINSFHTVFLTAYDEYALKAIKYGAFDYLLKPVDADELKKTIEKVVKAIQKSNAQLEANQLVPYSEQKLRLATTTGYDFVSPADIVYIKGDGNYSYLHTTDNQTYSMAKTIKDLHQITGCDSFIRIHKTYLVNKKYLSCYNKNDRYCVLKVQEREYRLPVSTRQARNLMG
jgi:two-component system, LytTR family, response regulator